MKLHMTEQRRQSRLYYLTFAADTYECKSEVSLENLTDPPGTDDYNVSSQTGVKK